MLDLMYFLIVIPSSILASFYSQIGGMVTMLLLNGLFMFLLTRNIKTSIIIISLAYMISIFADHLDSIIWKNFDVIIYLLLFIVIQFIISVVLYSIMKLINNDNKINKFEYSNFETAFSLISLLICLYLLIFVEVKQGNQEIMILYNTIIILLMAGVLLITHFSRIRTLKDKYVIQTKEARIKSNNQYIHEVERHYNELRTFRHNYQNVLLSLDEYLKTDDIKGLKEYYNKSIKPI